ncbi:MAG TPA: ankyrin repeat domain-containing protein [Candidatus Angelobacter sp.]|nr:ankyrin repeat domain-containing protein [Candidatus Angelobacter sp.]
MPTKQLPSRPDLVQLKHQAKDLMKARLAADPAALQRIREFHPRFSKSRDVEIASARFILADAQLTIAREYGYATWPRLKVRITGVQPASELQRPHHERIEDPVFRRAVDLLDAGDAGGLRAHLRLHPQLVRQRVLFEGGNYFRNPGLLEFVAENPVRNGKLPPNIVEVAIAILEAGSKTEKDIISSTLGLVCSGRVPRECGVQVPLIDLLCDYGAASASALLPALVHGEFAAVEALLRRGAALDLPTAAATGRLLKARESLALASSEDRHIALALAAQFGHVEIVRLLLDAGEDPSRYNPVGMHSHSTPLHQAALAGHRAVAELLVERGARKDLKDVLFEGTPADWARHAGHTELAEYLGSAEEGSPAAGA